MKKLSMCLGLAVLGLSLTVSTASAGLFEIVGPYAANVDTNPATTVGVNTALTGSITDLNVQIILGSGTPGDAYGDTYWGNFDITLNHGGTSVVLQNTIDDYWGSYNVTFDDAAASALSSSVSNPSGLYQPVGSLADFNGMDLDGNWSLTLLDDYIPNDSSDLIAWRIFGEVDGQEIGGEESVVPEPATMALFSSGLLGFFFKKRREA